MPGSDPHHSGSGTTSINTTEGGPAASRPWWLGGLVIALGCICLYGSYSLPQASRYAVVGPGMFVSVVGGLLVALGLMLLYQISQGEEFIPQDAEDADGNQNANWRSFSVALAGAVVPILTIEALGFPVTAMLSFTMVANAFGSRNTVMDIVIGAVLGSTCWILFTQLGLQLGGFLPIAGF